MVTALPSSMPSWTSSSFARSSRGALRSRSRRSCSVRREFDAARSACAALSPSVPRAFSPSLCSRSTGWVAAPTPAPSPLPRSPSAGTTRKRCSASDSASAMVIGRLARSDCMERGGAWSRSVGGVHPPPAGRAVAGIVDAGFGGTAGTVGPVAGPVAGGVSSSRVSGPRRWRPTMLTLNRLG